MGNGNDFSANVGDIISSTTGSFDSATNVESETGQVGGSGGQVANTFSLQLNVKPFTSAACGGSPNTGCKGWQQFIYSNGGYVFIQYWLLNYNIACPSGWNTYSFPGSPDIYCWKNGANATNVPIQSITEIKNWQMSGSADATGSDEVMLSVSGALYHASNSGSMLSLGRAWNGIEFIIVGDCCSSQANFNNGASIIVRTTVHHNSTSAPTCVNAGYTGETNNLNLDNTPSLATGASPAITSLQATTTGTASCASATGYGDVHLITVGGTKYDFQTPGEYVMAEVGSGFRVAARQAAFTANPNVSVARAVGIQMGANRIAICTAPAAALWINGSANTLNDGASLYDNGVSIRRRGQSYSVVDSDGNAVFATINAGSNTNWIDFTVNIGSWPSSLTGMLASASPSGEGLILSNGVALARAPNFHDIHFTLANSYALRSSQSLTVPCGNTTGQVIRPVKGFHASNLTPVVYNAARATCVGKGVKEGPLLDDCILDVGVLRDDTAANVYTRKNLRKMVVPSRVLITK